MLDGTTSVQLAVNMIKAGLDTPPIFYVYSNSTSSYHRLEVKKKKDGKKKKVTE
eukprot:TRINITY_DN7114_c0_g1_i1.p2 TRINITY_DN7114_c0_g1~~TRINITY_DN7114_c0_g1_i1.p2  ORF type:complete len:54 (+),score=8.83 TRINITY_DN7114_c0_g1_i1:96-257(+)